MIPVPELTRSQKFFGMTGALLGLLLAALDMTIVATAGPAIQRSLDISPSLYVWITTAYLVTSTVMGPIFGKLSDLFGRRAILVWGIVIFVVGSLGCGLSQTAAQLIAARALQGIGAAALFVSAFAVAADLFVPAERAKYQSVFGAMFAFASLIGPGVGGMLTDSFGWQWVFLINLPIGFLSIALILWKMPRLEGTGSERVRLDIAGALLLTASVVPFLIGLSVAQGTWREWAFSRWGVVPVWALLAASLVATVAFIAVERRASSPIVDLRLFSERTVRLSNLASFLLGATFLTSTVFLPLFLVNVLGLSATNSGLILTPFAVSVVVGNVVNGFLVSRVGRYKWLLVAWTSLASIGYALVAFALTSDATQASLSWKMVLIGLGLGPSLALHVVAAQDAAPQENVGVVTAMVGFSRLMGSTIGVALLGAAFATLVPAPEHDGAIAEERVKTHFRHQRRNVYGVLRYKDAASQKALENDALLDPALRTLVDAFDEPLAEGSLVAGPIFEDAAKMISASETKALQALRDRAARGKEEFTRSIKHVYGITFAIAVIGLLLTLLFPDRVLRKTQQAPLVPE